MRTNRSLPPHAPPVRPLARAAAVLLSLSLTTTACAAISTPGTERPKAATSNGSAPLFQLLPRTVQTKGEVTVVTDPTYPPFETLGGDGRSSVGLDPDLMKVIAAKLGIRARFERAGFETIIPGLQAGRYDMAMSAMTDYKEREKKVTFVDYYRVGGAIVMKPGDPAQSAKPVESALCGHKVATQVGTLATQLIKDASKKCLVDGKPAIDLLSFKSVPSANLALTAGRVIYVWTDSVTAATQVDKSGGQLAFAPTSGAPDPMGMVFPKGSTELVKAFRAALQAVIDDGGYAKVLAKYGLSQGAVKSAEVNGARN